jgi:RNA polymerase sigma-70 factor (ECF subfamily)
VWQRPDAWRPGQAQFSTWLYRVVMNRCLDLKRKPKPGALDAVAEPEDPRPDAEADLVAAARQQALSDAVEALPERQRAAIALTYTAGLKNTEAASALDISVKALEALLVRAKRELREALARQGWIQT